MKARMATQALRRTQARRDRRRCWPRQVTARYRLGPSGSDNRRSGSIQTSVGRRQPAAAEPACSAPTNKAVWPVFYVATKQFVAAEEQEQDAWAQLRGLESWTGPLGPEGRVHFISALQAARLELWETSVGAEVAFQRAKALGFGDFSAKTMIEGYTIPHAVCLPIDTPRERALQLLSGNSSIGPQPK